MVQMCVRTGTNLGRAVGCDLRVAVDSWQVQCAARGVLMPDPNLDPVLRENGLYYTFYTFPD